MTEEVTYANLKFENSHELTNITEPEDTKDKGRPTLIQSCWPVVLILSILCLVLLMVLVTLAVLLFQIREGYRTQLRDLNTTKNELHGNFSKMLQAIGNQLCLEGEKSFKNNGQNCVLCPANWKWEGGRMCYYISEEKKSWEKSHQFCSSQNATLLLIKREEKLELVKKFPRNTYWLGLEFRVQQGKWYWTDNTTLTEQQDSWTKYIKPSQPCAYLHYTTIYSSSCLDDFYYVCEKPAIQLQRGNSRWQEDWFVRPK
ncbi:C-type lectin domain family 12 member A-like [Porphyrio hochstetteri]